MENLLSVLNYLNNLKFFDQYLDNSIKNGS